MADRPASPQAADNPRQHTGSDGSDLAALIVAHHAAVYRYACRLCGCSTEAEDLAQQTFMIAQQKLHQLREPERAAAWLLAIVRSCFLKSLRKPRPTPAQDIELQVDQIADHAPELDRIDREELAAALATLPAEFRLILLMFYFEELSYQEIARQLNIPIGTVMSRLSRAKGHLRLQLAAFAPQRMNIKPAHRHLDSSADADSAGLRAAP